MRQHKYKWTIKKIINILGNNRLIFMKSISIM